MIVQKNTSVKITGVEVLMSNKKCIFDSTIDCNRFANGEYVCMIFKERCENFKYMMSHVENLSGEIVSLSFKGTT